MLYPQNGGRIVATDSVTLLHPVYSRYTGTSFGWGKGGNVTSAGWQVTLCDTMWRVSSRSGVATLRTAVHLLLTYLLPGSRRGPPADENSGCAPAAVCSSLATVCPGRKMSGGREGGGP